MEGVKTINQSAGGNGGEMVEKLQAVWCL